MAMATPENHSSSASERTTASNTADSYIGSLISLTSKSEIRYEGVLYNINTEESSIGLQHVQSFGTEERRKDGQQVPRSDKVYEYILFRGSDIKDLQVKSSPPVQSAPAINNDPAIIQSHYPYPVSTSTSLPASVSRPSPDTISNMPQMALPGSNFQGGLPLHQPGGNLVSWEASPTPSAGGSGLAMPMYWQGYYPPPNGLPHIPQQSLLRSLPGLQMPPMQQPMPIPYPGFNTLFPTAASNFPGSLPEGPSSLFPPRGSSLSMTSTSFVSLPSNVATVAPVTLPSTITSIPSVALSSDALLNSLPHKVQSSHLPPVGANPSFRSLPPLMNTTPANILAPLVTTKPYPIAEPTLQFQSTSQPALSIMEQSDSANAERANLSLQTPTLSLITPGQQSGSSATPSSQHLQSSHKDVEVSQASPSSPEPSVIVNADAHPPILPLPPQARAVDKSGALFQSRYGYRGRDRGRGARVPHSLPETKFSEDFDFMAMNEKFKKDEVWGHLGKSNKHQSKDKDSDGDLSEEESFHDDDNELSKIDNKFVYNKDEFFDSLSCNALDRDSQNGRTRFSEQMKLDSETFGDFSRYRGGQFGRGMNHGGGRTRGYYGRGYNYVSGRGRGRGTYVRPL